MKRTICWFVVCVVLMMSIGAHAEEALKVQHYLGHKDAIIEEYNKRHPENEAVVLELGRIATPLDALKQLGNGEIDVYVVHSGQTGFSEMISAPTIMTVEQEWIPDECQALLYVQGVQKGWIVEVDIESMMTFAVSQSVLEACEIDPAVLETNLLGLLTQITEWYKDGTLSGVKLLPGDNQRRLLVYIVTDYLRYVHCHDDGVIDTELLHELLSAAECLLAEMQTKGCDSAELPYLLTPCTAEDYILDTLETGKLLIEEGGYIARFSEPMIYLQCVPMMGMELKLPVVLKVAVADSQTDNPERVRMFLDDLQSQQQGVTAILKCIGLGETCDCTDHNVDMIERMKTLMPSLGVLHEGYEMWVNDSENWAPVVSLVEQRITVDAFIDALER